MRVQARPISDGKTVAFSGAVKSAQVLRERLHAHPELRFAETNTAALLGQELARRGYEIHPGLGGTGLLATRLTGPGPHVILRAELDALPVVDLKTAPYSSQIPGVCHACGHDVHMAILIAVAEVFSEAAEPGGRLSLLLQPAEEIPFGEPSGAQAILDSGILQRWAVDAIVALHAWPALAVGQVGIDRTLAMAGKYAFRVVLSGSGTHAATPQRGRDAILAAAQTVSAVHHIVSRQTGVEERAVINVGTIHGGRSQSIVSPEAELTGTIRWADADVANRLKAALENAVHGIALTYGVTSTLEWANEMPPVRNDAHLVEVAEEALAEILGDNVVRLSSPPMTTDDFALYAKELPGLYLKLGTCAAGDCPPLHSGMFDIDSRAIEVGVAALTHLVRRLLEPAAKSRMPASVEEVSAVEERARR